MSSEKEAIIDFIIIGAAKSGTTSLYQYLKQHPSICMSQIKETNFFSLEGQNIRFSGPGDMETGAHTKSISTIKDYQKTFLHCKDKQIRGEASPLYLSDKNAPKNIFLKVPNVKLIAILRNPVDRAYSSYMHLVRDQRETIRDFRQALDAEQDRIKNNYSEIWHYATNGFYYEQLMRYYKVFNAEQILVLFHDNIIKNRNQQLDIIYKFLNVETGVYPEDKERHNIGGIPKNNFVHNLIYNLLNKKNLLRTITQKIFTESVRSRVATTIRKAESKINLRKYPPISEEEKKHLINIYRDDIHKLENLLNKDLSNWLT